MKNIIIPFIILLFSSCSVFKKINKTENRTEVKTEVVSNNNTVTTEKETKTVDTTHVIKGVSLEAEKPIASIMSGDSIITENNQVKGSVSYDKNTGKLKLKTEQKPQVVPVKTKVEKVTTTNSNTVVNTKTATKTTDKTYSKKAFNLNWLLLLIPVILLIIFRKHLSFLKSL